MAAGVTTAGDFLGAVNDRAVNLASGLILGGFIFGQPQLPVGISLTPTHGCSGLLAVWIRSGLLSSNIQCRF